MELLFIGTAKEKNAGDSVYEKKCADFKPGRDLLSCSVLFQSLH